MIPDYTQENALFIEIWRPLQRMVASRSVSYPTLLSLAGSELPRDMAAEAASIVGAAFASEDPPPILVGSEKILLQTLVFSGTSDSALNDAAALASAWLLRDDSAPISIQWVIGVFTLASRKFLDFTQLSMAKYLLNAAQRRPPRTPESLYLLGAAAISLHSTMHQFGALPTAVDRDCKDVAEYSVAPSTWLVGLDFGSVDSYPWRDIVSQLKADATMMDSTKALIERCGR